MGFLHCCGALRRSATYSLAPENGYLLAELDVIENCPVCGHYVVQVTRIDLNHSVSVIRKSNKHARKLFEKLGTSVLYKQEYKYSPLKSGGTFYLNYNEYGVKKRCYSNFSSLRLGRFGSEEMKRVTCPIRLPGDCNYRGNPAPVEKYNI